MTVAERLEELMQKANITSQKRLAAASGISQTMIGKILRGESSPTIATLETLCAALNVTPAEFFSGIDDEDKDDIWELREALRRNPEFNMLFSVTRNATKEDILKAVKILKTLKGDEE
jgi:transcriptional regulator with XRE-family HTH domain